MKNFEHGSLFRTLSNIYDIANWLMARSPNLFLRKSPIIDVWQGPKYASGKTEDIKNRKKSCKEVIRRRQLNFLLQGQSGELFASVGWQNNNNNNNNIKLQARHI